MLIRTRSIRRSCAAINDAIPRGEKAENHRLLAPGSDQKTQPTFSAGSVSVAVFPPPRSHVTVSVQVLSQ